MAWTNPQKANVVRACKAIGREEMREVILRQIGGRAEHPRGSGSITSTSPRLTQRDYEQTMSLIEDYSGGQIQTRTKDRKHVYAFGHWGRRAPGGGLTRRLSLIEQLVAVLRGTPAKGGAGPALDADGNLLQGLIHRATRGRADRLDQLDEGTAGKVIDGLKDLGKRHGVKWNSNMAS